MYRSQIVKVISKDGTQIASWRSGNGSTLVLVHGASGDHTSFQLMTPLFDKYFTTYSIDRRGRGESGDAPEYSMEREFEDVVTVIDSIGGPVDIFGHSFGGSVALGASLLTRNLRRIIIYEASPGVMAVSHEILSQLEALLERGQREELVSSFMREVVGMSPERLKQIQASPQWANRVAIAHTIVRELKAEESWAFNPEQFQGLSNPSLLLLGSKSPEWAKSSTERVQMALPDSRVHILEGQGHTATVTAPELVATEVIRFLKD